MHTVCSSGDFTLQPVILKSSTLIVAYDIAPSGYSAIAKCWWPFNCYGRWSIAKVTCTPPFDDVSKELINYSLHDSGGIGIWTVKWIHIGTEASSDEGRVYVSLLPLVLKHWFTHAGGYSSRMVNICCETLQQCLNQIKGLLSNR